MAGIDAASDSKNSGRNFDVLHEKNVLTEPKTPIHDGSKASSRGHSSEERVLAVAMPDTSGVTLTQTNADLDLESASDSTQPSSRDSRTVDWDGDDDPHNPMNWTEKHKWSIIVLISAITFNTSMASTIFAPGVPEVQADFGDSSGSVSSLLVSIYIIGIALGPTLLSPLSEFYGRLIMVNTANIVFFIATVVCAVAVNIPMLVVFRFIMGLGCSVPLTTGGGVIADLIQQEKRGRALALWTFGPLLGPVIGPVLGGYISLKLTWRWTFWVVAILETYGPKLLQIKTERLRKETGRQDLRSKFDNGLKSNEALRMAIFRTIRVITRCPVVVVLTLFVSVMYSYLYILFTTLVPIFEGQYGFNSGEAGLTYLGLGIGFLIGQGILGVFSDRWLAKQKLKNGSVKPEDRLPPLVVGAFLFPIGLFWYGWTIEFHTHWIVPIVGSSLCGISMIFVSFPIQIYLVDAYTIYAVSAIAASVFVRSIFATCLPLAAPALYESLGYGWGNSLLGFLALLFAPCSLLLLKHGEFLRLHPKFQVDL